MTKLNWERVTKEQQDLRQRTIEEAKQYENIFSSKGYLPSRTKTSVAPPSITDAPQVDSQSSLHGQHSPASSNSGLIPCKQCGTRLNPKNLEKHLRKAHKLTDKERQTLISIRRLTKIEKECVMSMRSEIIDLRSQTLSRVEVETLKTIFGDDVGTKTEHPGLTSRQKEILKVLFANETIDERRVEREKQELEFRDFVEGSLEKMRLNFKLFGDLFAMNQLMGANDYVVGIMLLYFGDFLNLIDRVIKYANEKEELAATDAQEIVTLLKHRAKETKSGLRRITSRAPWN
jgi:hypothetical protein